MSSTPDPLAEVHAGIAAYYTGTVRKHGATPLGVDWSCVPTQELRFVQLLKLCDFSTSFSLKDLGCGYGALLAFLDKRYADRRIDYLGVDLSPAMIRHAKRLWRGVPNVRFARGACGTQEVDYTIASGIFNVRLEQSLERWERFVATTLAEMRAASRLGFAANFMAPIAGRETRAGLYRTAPEPWMRYCADDLGVDVELVNGYGMREFTLLLRTRASAGERRESRPFLH
jgi:hypothetical protein